MQQNMVKVYHKSTTIRTCIPVDKSHQATQCPCILTAAETLGYLINERRSDQKREKYTCNTSHINTIFSLQTSHTRMDVWCKYLSVTYPLISVF